MIIENWLKTISSVPETGYFCYLTVAIIFSIADFTNACLDV